MVCGARTCEPATARALLQTLDLPGMTATADALHAARATAELIHDHGGQFVFPVKENRRTLFDALNTLPWANTPPDLENVDTGHGRRIRRTIRVLPAPPDLPFPQVNQVWLIERYVTHTATGKQSAAAQLGVASHTPDQASPAELAAYNRSHWAIESLHWIRDTCYREDRSTTRTRSGPRYATSRSTSYAWPAEPTSRKPPHHLETAVTSTTDVRNGRTSRPWHSTYLRIYAVPHRAQTIPMMLTISTRRPSRAEPIGVT
ncbi:ISAs1 family transposase [Micromonospora sp. LOL_015]|uniref:ISAs1 family transposase n=1 Tax=Micromonospora sp. LOL_015 TaxID=3345416 RepID=UPI003A848620